jgi:hypothetical protein
VAVGNRLTLSAGIRYERQPHGNTSASFRTLGPSPGVVFDPSGKIEQAFATFGVSFAKIPSDLA